MIKLTDKKVVYFLGAGASARALPVINEMPAALAAHQYWIRNIYPASNNGRYLVDLEDLATASTRFGTVDTYARSLYLQGDNDRLDNLKMSLSVFFTLEQLAQRPIRNTEYEKQDLVDTRYLSWLAVLLSEKTIVTNVNVLSWNYDLQIEHALTLYGRESNTSDIHSNEHVTVYPSLQYNTSRRPFLIHLNGVAGLGASANGAQEIYYPSLHGANPPVLISELIDGYNADSDRAGHLRAAMRRMFAFAWEGNTIAMTGLGMAHTVMEEAEVLVIIGYSFPSFNRSIDKAMFRAFFRSAYRRETPTRIVIQSPSLDEQMFRHFFADIPEDVEIVVLKNVDQFYIPPELFT